jgi:ABC-type transporter MlaC component
MNNAILHSEKHSGDEKIDYLEEEKIPEMKGRILVKTRVEVPEKAVDFDVNYAMIYDEGKKRWRIYDLLLDEESLMQNYRDQFDVMIKSHSYDYLVQKMRKKLDENATDKTIKKEKKSSTSEPS